MKNSGIEWIGEIPDDWKVERLQWYIEEVKVSNNPMQTDRVLSLTNKAGVIPYEEKGAQGNVAKEDYTQYKLAYPNTIVANSMNILIGSVGICNYFGCVSPVYYVFKPTKKADLLFINYIMQTIPFQKELRRYANGILEIRLRVSANGILKRKIAIPSLEKQKNIVDGINKKCAAVDRLIENQQAQIEKLKEYKQSVISEAVTKGLDSTVPMKDSGVEWINNIAMSHNIVRLKFLLKENMLYGANESGENTCVEGVRYIRITDITADGKLKNDENNQYLKREIAKNYMLSDKDILFARSGGTVGKTFMYRASLGDSSFAGYLIKATCNSDKLLPEYLMYYTQSSLYMLWKSMIFIQATIQNIGANKYSNMEVVLPNIEGQQQIADYLDKKCAEIDNLISIKQQKIEKLQEYKKSLIYEYVTGKKQVLI